MEMIHEKKHCRYDGCQMSDIERVPVRPFAKDQPDGHANADEQDNGIGSGFRQKKGLKGKGKTEP